MQYLFAEEDYNGEGTLNYCERYFIMFPFCGLRWFHNSPEIEDHVPGSVYSSILLQQDETSGWVFGGGITVEGVRLENKVQHDNMTQESDDDALISLYPFVLTLKCHDETTQVRLASRDIESRASWVKKINEFASMQNYLL